MKTFNKFQSVNNILIRSLLFSVLAILLMISTGCSSIRLLKSEFTEDKRKNLPQNIETAGEDPDIMKETSVVVSINDDSGTFLFGKEQISEEQLTEKIAEKMKDKSPDKRIVYIESAVEVKYETIVKLLSSIRKADIEKAGFVVFKEKYEKLATKPTMVAVEIPAEPKPDDLGNIKPNPNTLVVFVDNSGKLRLNTDSMDNVNDTIKLVQELLVIFKKRENDGVFRTGTNEIEKTVSIKAAKSLRYGDIIKVIDAVKLSGAQPIQLQIDDLGN